MAIINERIKKRRLELNLTLAEVADLIGVKEATAQRYESGAIKSISHETICKLSETLHCSPSYLMGWDEQPSPSGSKNTLSNRDSVAYERLLEYLPLLNEEGKLELFKRVKELIQLPQYSK